MNTTHADRLHAELCAARDCDALDPCADCKAKAAVVREVRHAERVAALVVPSIPAPRTAMLWERLTTNVGSASIR